MGGRGQATGSASNRGTSPGYSWDGRWLTVMRRRAEGTAVVIVPVNGDGSFAGPDRWVAASPEDADAQRPRFAPAARVSITT